MSLTFEELRTANLARLKCFPGHEDADDTKYDRVDGRKLGGWTYNDWMVALTGEVGELANLLKKRRRGWVPRGAENWSQEKAAMELGDIQIYLDLLAACLNVDLGEATRVKFNIVSERTGQPDRL